MKKQTKILIVVISILVVFAGLGIYLYNTLIDENALSIKEKKWVDKNSYKVLSINVPNDIPIFGNEGNGVFFDYIDYLKKDIGMNLNSNTYSYNSISKDYHFEITSSYDNDALLLFKDHFVLVSKNAGIINDIDVANINPGVLNRNMEQVTSYYNVPAETFTGYNNFINIVNDLTNGTIQYALVPLNEFKEYLIKNNINVSAHISDMNRYYYFKLGKNKTLNTIYTKTFNTWKNEMFNESYNKHNYDLFIKNLGISDSDEDTLTNKVYRYGFTENRPYEIISSGSYGGITAEYLNLFSDFSGVEFTYKKYYTSEDLAEAVINGNIDLYYNYYNLTTNYIDASELYPISYYVIVDNNIDLSMSNINGLSYKNVYVLKNSYLYDLIKNIEGIKITTYDDTDELRKIVKKESIILLDSNTYEYYVNSLTNSYSVRYQGVITDKTYAFRYLNDKDPFYKLFSAYTKTIDPSDLVRTGIISYNAVNTKGKIVSRIAITILIMVALVITYLFLHHRKKKIVKIDTKVKKDDKLKYIDLLTSLKNRNYYNEKLDVWNKNKIYPQTAIVLDINKVKELNDTLGHEEGDKQIQAVANVLIKTQIDSSEIIRTDGNEFFIYLVGYSEKQVLSYIKKLMKEFKELPYNNGVAMGFSMIEDDTKLVEDAVNEASIKMRENKEIFEDNNDKKD